MRGSFHPEELGIEAGVLLGGWSSFSMMLLRLTIFKSFVIEKILAIQISSLLIAKMCES